MADLDALWKELEKDFGAEILGNSLEVKKLVLDSPGLNYIFGGGLARGRIVEIFGQESSGKTLLSYLLAANFQRHGEYVVFVDFERAFDPVFARSFGVETDSDKFRHLMPEQGEDGFDIIEKLILSKRVGLIVVDSVSAMVPREELEAEYTDVQMGSQGRMMSKGLRKLTAHLGGSDVVIIFTNQIRNKIGVMYGSPNVTSGGNALKFYSSVRMEVSRVETIPKELKDGEDVLGIKVRMKNVKNKTGNPYRKLEVDILFAVGIDKIEEYANFAVLYGVFKKSGAWFSFKEEKYQGFSQVVKAMKENEELAEEVIQATNVFLGISQKLA